MPTSEGAVSLTVDFSNGVRKEFAAIPWQSSMDVLGALEAAKSQPPGLDMETWTSRAAFVGVGALDGVHGFPSGGASDRWLAWVNSRYVGDLLQPGRFGTAEEQRRVSEAAALQPGDAVLLKLSSETWIHRSADGAGE